MITSNDSEPLARESEITLARLTPRLQARFSGKEDEWTAFKARLEAHFPRLFKCLIELYGAHYDFFYHLESLLTMSAGMWLERAPDLKELDREREAEPAWFQSQEMLGGVCYVQLFSVELAAIRDKIPYFRELGLTYLHLMPIFLAPEGNNDGGYAVSSYRELDPAVGSMEHLAELAGELRDNGISLVLDFVFNHTSDEHEWALQAAAGDPRFQLYYYIFHDRTMPDAYEKTLREIFPDQRPGNFTYRPDIDGWVWTTFNSFQWDLAYLNPEVFTSMAEEMLFLANRGVEILRFDALAFIWKKLGTSCENLPEVHTLIQAFNALARITAPSLLFKSEAIVHPDEVIKYIGPDECQLSYNPLLMALLWEALATREVRLLQLSMRERAHLPAGSAWVNYIRSHDDIGWTFDDADAGRLGINGFDHRRFLNAFYTGRFPDSFATGLPFQENPRTGDARISGTCASLAGLEKAIQEDDPEQIELSARRVVLLYSVIFSIGGIPLIYLGDEVGTLNDYAYWSDPAKAGDSRWVHRPYTDWRKVARRKEEGTVEERIYGALTGLIAIRKGCRALADGQVEILEAGNPHVFAYVRRYEDEWLLALANFSEHPQTARAEQLGLYAASQGLKELITGEGVVASDGGIELMPYQCMWLVAAS